MGVGGVLRIEVTERERPVFGGTEFGAVGPYERLHGTIFGELDPTHPLNAGIVNLDRAARNARGNVEYHSDFRILKPLDLDRGNGCLVYDVPNRGNQPIMPRLNGAPDGGHPPPLSEASGPLSRRDYQALRTLSGVAPVTKRSGKSHVVVMRYASHVRLRNTVYHWARVATQHDHESRTRYAALRRRGHSHGRAICGVADRLLAVACVLLQRQTLFDPHFRQGTAS